MNEAGSFLKEAENLSDWLKKQADIKKYGKEILSSELKKFMKAMDWIITVKGMKVKHTKNKEKIVKAK